MNFLTPKDLNFKNADGETPLYVAVGRNNLKVTEYLIRLGANVNLKVQYGNTCLHKAMMIGNVK